MKNLLLVHLILILFIITSSVSTANEYDYLYRLSCPQVLKSCVDIDFLVDQEYLPEGYSSDDLETLFEDYSSSDLQEICKGCCVAESKNSKCITRCLNKCRK